MIEFKGFTQKQAAIIKKPLKRLVVLSGAVRSGKTFLSYFMIPLLIKEFGINSRGIVLGKTLGMIEENILIPMRELFGYKFIGDIKSDTSGNRYVNIFGAKVRCVGANDKKSDGKIRGTTYSWAVCDEVATYPENVFHMLMSRLSEPNAKCICTTNPENPSHWFKVRYIDNPKIEIDVYNFKIDDNPTLTVDYVENLKNIYRGTELYDRLIDGLWVSGQGAIYKNFIINKDKFIKTIENNNKFIEYSVGIDFGENKSSTTFSCIGLWRGSRGFSVLADERINTHGTPQDLQDKFIRFLERCISKGWKPSYCYYDNAQCTLGKGLQSAVAKKGYEIGVVQCVKDQIIERIHQIQTLFGAGMIEINVECKESIKAFSDALWADDETRLDEVSPTNPIDMLDAIEYAFQKWSKNLLLMALYGGKKIG